MDQSINQTPSPSSFLLHFLDPFSTGFVNYKSFIFDLLGISIGDSTGLTFPQKSFLKPPGKRRFEGGEEVVEEEEEEGEEEEEDAKGERAEGAAGGEKHRLSGASATSGKSGDTAKSVKSGKSGKSG